ncbi:MAG: hypothetical protein RLZZ244_689, partial [Verrucomicrobiota bacterium]
EGLDSGVAAERAVWADRAVESAQSRSGRGFMEGGRRDTSEHEGSLKDEVRGSGEGDGVNLIACALEGDGEGVAAFDGDQNGSGRVV